MEEGDQPGIKAAADCVPITVAARKSSDARALRSADDGIVRNGPKVLYISDAAMFSGRPTQRSN